MTASQTEPLLVGYLQKKGIPHEKGGVNRLSRHKVASNVRSAERDFILFHGSIDTALLMLGVVVTARKPRRLRPQLTIYKRRKIK